MPDPQELLAVRGALAEVKAARAQTVQTMAARTADLTRLDGEIARAVATGDQAGAEAARQRRAAAAAARQQAAGSLGAIEDRLRDVIGQLQLDPCDADPGKPLLLLPLRLETRFAPDRAGLRIRIFPDDIHIDQLDRGLADAERQAGIAYWTVAWRGSDAEAGTAFRDLIAAVGRSRATWVGLATQPTNLANREAEALPVFPETTPRTRRAAVARLLPDRFVAVAVQGGQRSTATGNPVAPEVTVSLFADDGSSLKDVNGLKVLPGAVWLADYAEAERIGMALTVKLAQPGPVDRLLVFGVDATGAATAEADLADLLTAHRCTGGLAFVPQGTPSNNTESDRAAWSARPEPDAPARAAVALPADANASVLSGALGVPLQGLATLEAAPLREQGLAKAMSVALWGATWETFLEKINRVTKAGATLSDPEREQVRVFARDAVRGRGPLPAIRVGSQPYGLLPTSLLAGWDAAGDGFTAGLLALLQRMRGKWRSYLDNVPRLGSGALDDTMRELLGSAPVSLALRVRDVLTDDLLDTAQKVTGATMDDLAVERLIEDLVLEEVILNASLIHRSGSLSANSRPLALPFTDPAKDADVIEAIANGQSPQISSVLQALVALSWDRASSAVKNASAGGRLIDVLGLASESLPAATRDAVRGLAAQADRAPAAAFFQAATRVATSAGPIARPSTAEVQPVQAYAKSFGELALQSTTDKARGEFATLATIAWLQASARLAELKAALADLVAAARGAATPDALRIAFAETLDLASHRLDAWLTGVVEQRRQAQRAAQPQGITIGAYGWVENIAPGAAAPADGGYIAAPTQAHAATAGILRSAYLAHNPDAAGSNAFAIDLSSARVRGALGLLDGIRQGQSLGVLLGYRLERRIHELGLDRLILSFRAIAPLSQGRLTDRNLNLDIGAIEVLAASNVTDGVQLIEKYQGKVSNWDAVHVRSRLNDRPKDNPYLTGPWPVLSDAEWASVAAAIEGIAADMDSVADLLMAESVHQLAQGNTPRAGAALDAAGAGDTPPPEPEVVSSRQEQASFTHRMLILAQAGAGWSATRPRAAAAPLLEAWAAARLGDPATIIVGEDGGGAPVALAGAAWAALDLVYESADPAGLERRLRAALPALSGDPLLAAPQPGWAAGERAYGDVLALAGSLRRLLLAARPADGTDLAVPNTKGARRVDPAEIAAVAARLQTARGLLAAEAQALDAALAVDPADPATLLAATDVLAAFGIAPPGPVLDRLASLGHVVLSEATKRLQAADAALAKPSSAETLVEAGQALFGDGFWCAPALAAAPGGDAWGAAFAAGAIAPGMAALRRYLTDRAAVLDGVRGYVEAMMLGEAVGAPPAPRAVQLAGAGADIPAKWIGGALDPAQPTTTAPIVSAAFDATPGYDPQGAVLALLVDHWMEATPLRERRGEAADAPVESRAAGGLAFNANAAGARAPQALLLGIAPDTKRWSTDRVAALLEETLDLAKLRLVTLERTDGAARILPALYAQSWSLQGEKVLDFSFIAEKAYVVSAVAAYVKE